MTLQEKGSTTKEDSLQNPNNLILLERQQGEGGGKNFWDDVIYGRPLSVAPAYRQCSA